MLITRILFILSTCYVFSMSTIAHTAEDMPKKDADYYINILNGKLDKNIEIVAEFAAMSEKDQYLRRLFIPMLQELNASPEERKKLKELSKKTFDRIDGQHTARLKEILKKYSWQQLNEIDQGVAGNAWTIVQHSGDIEFQMETLEKIKPLVFAKKMTGSKYALLLDRIATYQDRKQTYGTQSACKNGKMVPYPIADPEGVDERRKEIGLHLTLDDYFKQLVEIYGEKCSE